MEYVKISPPFISSARPLKNEDKDAYAREGGRLLPLLKDEGFHCGIFNRFGDLRSAKANCLSLYYHQLEQQNPLAPRSRFIAIFKKPLIKSLQHYNELLNEHLNAMHDFDSRHFQVNPYMIRSKDEKEFEFTLGGRIYGISEFHSFKEDFNEYYDLVVLAFKVKHNGRQVFPPRQDQISVKAAKHSKAV